MLTAIGGWIAKSVLMQSPIGAFLAAIWRGLKRFFGLLDAQGWIGLGLVIFLAFKWIGAAGDARSFAKQSARYEQLRRREHLAFGQTVLNYRAAAETARQADVANKLRVQGEQAAINERTDHDYEARLADASALAERLRGQLTATAAHPGAGGAASVPGLPAAASGPPQAAGQDGFSLDDRFTATAQAIQLDELIKWTRRLAAVDPNAPTKPAPDPPGAQKP